MTGPLFFKKRLVKDGPYVGVKLWVGYPTDPLTLEVLTERSYCWRAEINGEGCCWTECIETFDPMTKQPIMWGASVPIDEAEYKFFVESAKWAEKYDPDAPEANVRKKIDHLKTAPLF